MDVGTEQLSMAGSTEPYICGPNVVAMVGAASYQM